MDKSQAQLDLFKPWAYAAYVHNIPSKHKNLGLRGKKRIIIKYLGLTKGYILVGENKDGQVRDFESRNGAFIKNEFPKLGKSNKYFTFYEI